MAAFVSSSPLQVCCLRPEGSSSLPLVGRYERSLLGVRRFSRSRLPAKVTASTTERDCSAASPTVAPVGRSHILRSLMLTAGAASLTAGRAQAEETFVYTDSADKWSLQLPAGWESGEGKAGTRRVVAFYPPADRATTNVNLVVTMVGADFTGLGSFGTPEMFGETLVNGLDRSWKRPPGQAAKLVSATSSGGFYMVEYTIQKVGEPKVCFISAVGLRDNGMYNRLFTLTGQYLDEQTDLYREPIKKAVRSFQLGG